VASGVDAVLFTLLFFLYPPFHRPDFFADIMARIWASCV
jgi:hypothetical protein